MTGYFIYGPHLALHVYGTPGPQGSKRVVVHRRTGQAVALESSAKVAPWREAVVWRARNEMDSDTARVANWPLSGPVRLDITFTLNKPASAPIRRTTWPVKKPDLDKLARSTFDGLKTAGVYRDDAQVVEALVRKTYPGEHPLALAVPGAVISVYTIGDPPARSGCDQPIQVSGWEGYRCDLYAGHSGTCSASRSFFATEETSHA